MTMESHEQTDQPSAGELVRTMAISSAELWQDLLDRLAQVQASQAALARAIEELGSLVRNVLGGAAALPHGAEGAEPLLLVGPVPASPSLPTPGLSIPPGTSEEATPGSPAPADASATVPQVEPKPEVLNALLGTPGAAPPPPPGASFVAPETPHMPEEPAHSSSKATLGSGAPPDVPEPLFYVPPLMADEEPRATADSGPSMQKAPPGGDGATARAGSASSTIPQTPKQPGPALPPLAARLTPGEVDAVLASEFGEAALVSSPLGSPGLTPATGTAAVPEPAVPEPAVPGPAVPGPAAPGAGARDSASDLLDSILGAEFMPATQPGQAFPPPPQDPFAPGTRLAAPPAPSGVVPPAPPPGFQVRPEAIVGWPLPPPPGATNVPAGDVAGAPVPPPPEPAARDVGSPLGTPASPQSHYPPPGMPPAPGMPPPPSPGTVAPPPPPGMTPPPFGAGAGDTPPPPGAPPGFAQPPAAGPSDVMSLASEVLGAAPATENTPEEPVADTRPIAEDVTVFGRSRPRRIRLRR